MIKKFKKVPRLLLSLALLITALVPIIDVNAAGSATVSFGGNATVNNGSNISISVAVSGLSGAGAGGICNVEGAFIFDSTYFDYVSFTSASGILTTSFNPANGNYIGIDMTGGAMKITNGTIFTVVLKAKQNGTTSVSLNNSKMGDCTGVPLSLTNPSAKTITIGSAPVLSTNNYLSALSVSGQTISPSFVKTTTAYTLSVPNSVSSITVNATKEDSAATITSGTGTCNLSVGSNTCNVVVKSESSANRTYTITVTRASAALSTNNNLSNLSVSGYTMSPTFDKGTTNYTLTVPNSAASVIIQATKEDSAATITGAGTCNLNVGSNTCNVIVKSESGVNKTYTITITRQSTSTPGPTLSSDATLKSLNVSGYTLTPTFNKNTTNYTITVQSSITGLNVTALATDSKATVSVTGNKNWGSGTNNITIKVTAEDGSIKNYIVTVKRPTSNTGNGTGSGSTATKSTNNYLKSITVKDSTLKFDKNTNNYSINVPYDADKLDLTALSEDGKAKVEILGNENFLVGEVNVVEVKVTAEDGSLRIYTINVTRSAIMSQNKLSDLSVKDYPIDFDPDQEEYSIKVKNSVNELDLDYLAQDKDAKVEVIGNENLVVGKNVIRVKVTDKNGFVRTYFINVEKEAEPTILGMNTPLFIGLSAILLAILSLLLLLLLKRNKKEVTEAPVIIEKEKETNIINDDKTPDINFNPIINIGSQNDSEIVSDQAVLTHSKNTTKKSKSKPKVIDYKEADYKETSSDDEDYDVSELVEALKDNDSEKIKMFKKQVEVTGLKDELRGLDPSRKDDLFDDQVTVREIIKAIEKYEKTGNSKELKLLLKQYEANRLKKRISKQ